MSSPRSSQGQRPRQARLALAAALGAGLLLASACGSPDPLALCGQIPEGGCPIGRGGTCDDSTCRALYDCIDARWTQTKHCRTGTGVGGGGGGGSSGSTSTGGMCTMVTLDHTGELTGCTPDLQSPDCPAEAAETCAETACLTGCLDFFLCTKDGWTDVAQCDDQGVLTVLP